MKKLLKLNKLKQATALLMVLTLVIGLVNLSAFSMKAKAAGTDEVQIVDENLRKAICNALNKEYTEGVAITEDEMAGLTELVAENSGITDLTGIDKAVNIEKLDLSGNLIDDSLRETRQFGKSIELLASLTKLKDLNLSNCKLGDNSSLNASLKVPDNCLTMTLMMLPDLENVNLSNNDLTGMFGIYTQYGGWMKIKTLDVSNNRLNSFGTVNTTKMTQLEEINLSNNYIFWDERDGSWVTQLMSLPETIKIDYSNQKSLAEPYAAYYCANGIASNSYSNFKYAEINQETREINLGTVSGDVTFGMSGYTTANSTKVTIGDEKFTVLAIDALNELTTDMNNIVFSDLAPGEYSYPVEVMHMGGQKEEYTLKFTMAGVPTSDSEESAGIKNPSLQYAVCKAIGKTDEFDSYVVTKADMEKVKTLNISNVKDVSGVEYAKNLTSLSLNGTYETVPEGISELTSLKTLSLISENLTTLVDISKLTNLTSLSISQTRDGRLTDVSSQTKLTTLNVYYSDKDVVPTGIDKCKVLRTFNWTSASGKHSVPSDISTTYKQGLSISITNPRNDAEFNFDKVGEITAPKVKISISNYYGGNNVKVTGIDRNAANVTSFGMTAGYQSMIPDTLGEAPDLTSISLKGDFSTIPESFIGNTTVKTVTIEGATKYPETINKMKGIESLSITQSNNIDYKSIDWSGLGNLTKVSVTYCDIEAVPEADKLPANVTQLNLNNNKISEFAGGDYSKLNNVTTLNLENNNFTDFPSDVVSNMTSITTLKLQNNYYAEIAKDTFDNLTKLKTLSLGNYIPVQTDELTGNYVVDERYKDTKTAVDKAEQIIKSNGGKGIDYSVGYLMFFPDEYSYAGLANLNSNEGVLAKGITQSREVFAMLNPEATSVTLKPETILPDTTIVYNGKEYKSGEDIVIDNLVKGNNEVVLTCKNDFSNSFDLSKEVTYTITLFAGNTILPDELEDGHTYKINYKLYKSGQTVLSMSSAYFLDNATVRYKDGKYEVNVTTTQSSYISDMDYYDENNNRLDAELVEKDGIKDTAIYRVKLNDLKNGFVLSPYVVPMGYYPQCDVVFDLNSIIDITDTLPSVDTTDLNIAINQALEITDKHNIYTDDTYSALTKALEAAQKVSEDKLASQEEVDEALAALNSAINGLVIDEKKLADKTALKSVIDEASAIEKGNHTDAAWNALAEAIADAKAVMDNQNALQSEVDLAAKALKSAITIFNNSGDASQLDKNNLEDGVYSIYADMIKMDRANKSMADNAINHTVKLEVKNGEYYITLDFRGITIENRFGYLKNLSYYTDGYVYGQNGTIEGTLEAAEVLSTQKDTDGNDVIDQYNDKNSLYPDIVRIKLVKQAIADADGYVPLHVFVPIMEAIAEGNGDQDVLMKLDWTSLKKTTEDDDSFKPQDPVEQSPAVDVTDAATGVKVHADKGVFEEGVQLVVTPITAGDVYNKAVNSLTEVGKKFRLYEVHFEDADKAEVQPNGTVTVYYPIPDGYDSSKLALYRINEDGTKTLVNGVAEDGYYKVVTKSFSTYALVEKGSTITDSENTAVIEAAVSAGGISTGETAGMFMWIILATLSSGAGLITVKSRLRKSAK